MSHLFTCTFCGIESTARSKRQIVCSSPECIRQHARARQRRREPCDEEGCNEPRLARGMCPNHYSSWHRAQKKYAIECAECGKPASVGRKTMKYCSKLCANRSNARAWQQTLAERRCRAVVLYVRPRRPEPQPVHHVSNRVMVSGRCLVCQSWFVSTNRRDQTCSAECRETRALDSKRRGKQRRRAIQRSAYVADVYRRQVYDRDGWRCHLCGKPVNRKAKAPHPRSATIDHLIPLAAGGTHEPTNCRTAHFLCNARKGDRGGGEQLLLIA